jgi:hypothetical protein
MRKRAKTPSKASETLNPTIAKTSVKKYLILKNSINNNAHSKVVDKIIVKMLKNCV